jgi:ferredoxin
MGHIAAKDIYRQLGTKIDNLSARTPWNDALFAILKELYSEREAELVVAMPYGLSTIQRIANVTSFTPEELKTLLAGLCTKGLVIDLWQNNEYLYVPSPLVIGIFEFTMMRTVGHLNSKKWAELFHDYLQGDDSFYAANLKDGGQVALMRALPHEEAINSSSYVEVLDYEKAAALVEESDRFAVGLCSCRHEKHHLGTRKCKVDLETCTSLGVSADYIIRNNFGREISKGEMHEILTRSKEMGLVLNADNVKKNINFICHCCKCCCNALAGISQFGYANGVLSSSFLATLDEKACLGCGKCAKACPINGITMTSAVDLDRAKQKKKPLVDTEVCLGCGVCGLQCESDAISLIKKRHRFILPETTFEKAILTAVEKGTLQNLLFDNPSSITHTFMRGFVGAFAKLPPVKKALMSDMFRSSFLAAMKNGVIMQGKSWLLDF